MLANGLNLEDQYPQFFPGELSPCDNACWVSGDSLTTHMVVYSPVARMATLNGGTISRTWRVDVKEPVRTQSTGSDHSHSILAQLIIPPPLAPGGYKR